MRIQLDRPHVELKRDYPSLLRERASKDDVETLSCCRCGKIRSVRLAEYPYYEQDEEGNRYWVCDQCANQNKYAYWRIN